MISQTDLSGKLAIDSKGLDELRQSAKDNSPDALKAAAKQFEALFMNMMLKSMRQATPQEGMFDNEQSRMYTSMLDQQLSQNMASRGIGLADVLTRQLSNKVSSAGLSGMSGISTGISDKISAQISAQISTQLAGSSDTLGGLISGMPGTGSEINNDVFSLIAKIRPTSGMGLPTSSGLPLTATPFTPKAALRSEALPAIKTGLAPQAQPRVQAPHVKEFQQRLSSHAEEASRATGIPAQFMLGQAALESGWGRKEIKAADGTPSHNLFGIKAGASWKGKTVETSTTEYVNGVAQKKIQTFRAYDSYADAFKDYGKLLSNNPRYQDVIDNAKDLTSFARGLQRAGYATDPNYAEKLVRVIRQTMLA
ncbi:MAG: flagellar assembly peptidoglycan hydrolase FlgJ [Pseudomonadota bacterium]